MSGPGLELQIGALALEGFPALDAGRLRAALSAGLQRRLAEGGLPGLQDTTSLGRVDGGSFSLDPSAGVEAWGEQLAQAIYASLGGGK